MASRAAHQRPAGGHLGAVAIIIGITTFTHGAWVVIIAVPAMVAFLIRLARRDQREEGELEQDVPAALRAETPARHVVTVLIERLDVATARAVQWRAASPPTSSPIMRPSSAWSSTTGCSAAPGPISSMTTLAETWPRR